MVDPKELRHRVAWKLAASPLTLVPFAAGVLAMLGGWVFDLPGPVLFAGLTAAVAGVASAGLRWAWGPRQVVEGALADLQQADRAAKDRALDDLFERLKADGDPRTERWLHDLRELLVRFDAPDIERYRLPTVVAFELSRTVQALFDHACRELEHSLELHAAAQRLQSPEARRELEAQRSARLDEVGRTAQRMARLLADLDQYAAAGAGAEASKLAELRGQLDRQIEHARQIDAEMRAHGLDRRVGQ
ncbi:MAG: hypothetical protein EXR79_02465 [Myxococcales bacterium]|nr:hypothetical protein [Myxococcales bacterium]